MRQMVNGLLTISIKVNVPGICRIEVALGDLEYEKDESGSRPLQLDLRTRLGHGGRQRLKAVGPSNRVGNTRI